MAKAAPLFYSPSDSVTLYSRIVPSDEQTAFLQKKWNSLADFLVSDLKKKSGVPIATYLQGSYKFGTVLAPLDTNEEYDVDLGAYFCWTKETENLWSAKTLKTWVQESLVSFSASEEDAKEVEVPPKERCARIRYKNQFHIDVPAYHLDEDLDERRLATETKGWERSDPKAIHKWFIEKVDDEDRPQTRRIVRYIKAWAVLNFEPELRPSSILLTVLATEAFVELEDNDLDDEDALCAVIESICSRLDDDTVVINPAERSEEDLNRLEGVALDQFLSKLNALRGVCRRAQEAEDEGDAALIWDEVFTHIMPLPDDSSIELVENGQQISIAPVISIEVVDDVTGRYINKYTNEVPAVPKKCKLIYRIENSHLIPADATIDWVVRNEGDEAIAKRDLGHAYRNTRNLENVERTAYFGRHFMDCIIRRSGNVIAVKRVPVYITDADFKKPLRGVSHFRRFLKRKR